jgi:hypothetical protein
MIFFMSITEIIIFIYMIFFIFVLNITYLFSNFFGVPRFVLNIIIIFIKLFTLI